MYDTSQPKNIQKLKIHSPYNNVDFHVSSWKTSIDVKSPLSPPRYCQSFKLTQFCMCVCFCDCVYLCVYVIVCGVCVCVCMRECKWVRLFVTVLFHTHTFSMVAANYEIWFSETPQYSQFLLYLFKVIPSPWLRNF